MTPFNIVSNHIRVTLVCAEIEMLNRQKGNDSRLNKLEEKPVLCNSKLTGSNVRRPGEQIVVVLYIWNKQKFRCANQQFNYTQVNI